MDHTCKTFCLESSLHQYFLFIIITIKYQGTIVITFIPFKKLIVIVSSMIFLTFLAKPTFFRLKLRCIHYFRSSATHEIIKHIYFWSLHICKLPQSPRNVQRMSAKKINSFFLRIYAVSLKISNSIYFFDRKVACKGSFNWVSKRELTPHIISMHNMA